MKRLFAYCLIAVVFFLSQSGKNRSQSPLTFNYTEIDTHIVSDEPVYLKGFFPFYNHTDTPVVINRVNASYGGMTANWPKHPIMPHDTDTIWYKMQLWKGFRGPFNKSMTVRLGGVSSNATTKILHVKGYVEGPNDAKLVFEQTKIDLDTLPVGTIKKLEFPFTNQGKGPLVIQNVQVSKNSITTSWQNEVFEPGDTGLVFATVHVNHSGRMLFQINVSSNDPANPTRYLFVEVVGE